MGMTVTWNTIASVLGLAPHVRPGASAWYVHNHVDTTDYVLHHDAASGEITAVSIAAAGAGYSVYVSVLEKDVLRIRNLSPDDVFPTEAAAKARALSMGA